MSPGLRMPTVLIVVVLIDPRVALAQGANVIQRYRVATLLTGARGPNARRHTQCKVNDS
jgi:hypothetical protein